jgi:hypothetical protein
MCVCVSAGEVVEGTITGWPVDEMWTFDHFYEWWSSPHERQPHPALTAADHATLAALRAKLRSARRAMRCDATRLEADGVCVLRAGRSHTCALCTVSRRGPS